MARRHPLKPEMVRCWTREATKAAHPEPDALSRADENERLKRLLGVHDLQLAVLLDLLRKEGIRP